MKCSDLLWYVMDYMSGRIVSCGCATEQEARALTLSLSKCTPRSLYRVFAA